MFKFNHILSIAFVIAIFFMVRSPLYADYDACLDLSWWVQLPGEGGFGYVDVDTVTAYDEDGIGGDDYLPEFDISSAPTPGWYTFTTSFQVAPLENISGRVKEANFLFSFFAYRGAVIKEILIILESGDAIDAEYDDEKEYDDAYSMAFTIDGENYAGEHQIQFLLYLEELEDGETYPNSSDFGFKFGTDGIVSGAQIISNTTPEPATLLVFALASSAAAIPAVRRFRKK